jgi:hypothetical protein
VAPPTNHQLKQQLKDRLTKNQKFLMKMFPARLERRRLGDETAANLARGRKAVAKDIGDEISKALSVGTSVAKVAAPKAPDALKQPSPSTRQLENQVAVQKKMTTKFVQQNFPKNLEKRLAPHTPPFKGLGRSMSNPFNSERYALKEAFHKRLKHEATSTIKIMKSIEHAKQHG